MDTGLNHFVFGLFFFTFELFGREVALLNWLGHQLERYQDGGLVVVEQHVD